MNPIDDLANRIERFADMLARLDSDECDQLGDAWAAAMSEPDVREFRTAYEEAIRAASVPFNKTMAPKPWSGLLSHGPKQHHDRAVAAFLAARSQLVVAPGTISDQALRRRAIGLARAIDDAYAIIQFGGFIPDDVGERIMLPWEHTISNHLGIEVVFPVRVLR